uniref:Uncharacterized protein n=1 Tax=viral metagenome TaxID=1070528 RepID=A0A6C0M0S6_9ZZZZ
MTDAPTSVSNSGFRFFPPTTIMKRTPVVLGFFVAAILFGLLVRSMYVSTGATETAPTVKKEGFANTQMPMQAGSGSAITGVNNSVVISGSEPSTVPESPYTQVNDRALFEFDQSPQGPQCCPSPFSGDLGCVCVSDRQHKEFASRGGNRTPE